MNLPKYASKSSGETYLEVIIAVGIFIILSQVVLLLANTGYELIGFTRARNTAQTLGRTKMEYARNLPFTSIGTVGGIPTGSLAQKETVAINGQVYTVTTTVLYIDDKFDGISPIDTVPNDYKRVRIEVTWKGFGTNDVKTILTSDIAPKGIESVTGGGTLSFLVFNSTGNPVQNAAITVTSSGLNPQVNLNVVTNDNGRIVIPGAPACVKCYRVTATKSGMSTDRTYGATEVANPAKPDLTVVAGQLTEMSFAIDQLATINLNTYSGRDTNFLPAPTQTLLLRGQKTIGTDTLDNPVYKYSQNVTTDLNGALTISNLEWDTYTIIVPSTSTRTLGGTNPLIPFPLSPSASTTLKVSLPTKTPHSLLTAFVTQSRTPIASVSATLIDGGVNVATQSAGLADDPDFGQVFFANLSTKTYTETASVSGYQNTSNQVVVNGNKIDEITLSP